MNKQTEAEIDASLTRLNIYTYLSTGGLRGRFDFAIVTVFSYCEICLKFQWESYSEMK